MQNTNDLSLSPAIEFSEFAVPKYDYGLGLLVVFCLVDAVFILSKIFEWLSPRETAILSDSNQLATSCLAVLMTLMVVRHPALDPETKRSWKILALAYFTYGIGNLFWFYYSTMLNEKPFPTMADGGYWGFYPIMFWALLSFPASKSSRSERLKFLMDVAIVMLGGITAVWHFIIQPILASATDSAWVAVFLNLSYTVGDLVLMLGIATVLLRGVAVNHRKPLYMIIVGLVSMSVADYGFAYLTLDNTYYAGHWIDTFFQTSSLAFAFASFYKHKQLSTPFDLRVAETEVKLAHRFGWLPYLAVLLACTMLLVVSQPYWTEPLGLIIFASIGIMALVVFRQIAAVKENVRLQAEQNAQQSELKLGALVQNSSDLITILDRENVIVYESPSLRNVLGYEIDEVVGKSSHELLHPDDLDQRRRINQDLLSGIESVIRKELRFKHKDGSWRVLETVSRFIDDEGSNLTGIIINSRDITTRKRDEEKLRIYTQRLERSNRELQDFAYVASHDLQEPLRKVQAFGDRLEKKYAESLADEARDYITRMRDASARMQTLINDLLTFSRVTTKTQPFEPVTLSVIAREVISDLEVRIEETGAKVEIEEFPAIDADPVQVRQLLQNLIGNALKFKRPDQSPIVRVYPLDLTKGDLSVGKAEDQNMPLSDDVCRFVVEDNGIGFEEKYLDRIFTVFQRLHGRSEYEGSGVGLAVCRKIVERHSGMITAESELGKGSRFIVTLPLRQAEGEFIQ